MPPFFTFESNYICLKEISKPWKHFKQLTIFFYNSEACITKYTEYIYPCLLKTQLILMRILLPHYTMITNIWTTLKTSQCNKHEMNFIRSQESKYIISLILFKIFFFIFPISFISQTKCIGLQVRLTIINVSGIWSF